MPNEKNKQVVESIKDKVARAKAITFTNYLGISASDASSLRQKLKETDAEILVTKNTLLKVALKANNIEAKELDKDLEGPTAAVFSFGDPVTPIKALFDFAKKAQFPKIKSAIIEGIYTTAGQVEIIKDLPSKDQLIAQVVGTLKAPLSSFVGVMSGVQRKFVYAIKAVADKKQ